MADWLRHGPAKPFNRVRFSASPQLLISNADFCLEASFSTTQRKQLMNTVKVSRMILNMSVVVVSAVSVSSASAYF